MLQTCGRIDEGIPKILNLRMEAQQFHQPFQTPEDDQYWSKHVVHLPRGGRDFNV
jgi:hypothetical protein